MPDSLVIAIAAGDTLAFGEWMRGAERPMRESLRRFATSVDTEAVLQEALLRIWQVAPRFRSDGRPNGLLRLGIRIAHNLAISEIRKRHRDVDLDLAELERHLIAAEATAPAMPDPHLRDAIENCREQLPPQPRSALDARLTRGGADPDALLAEQVGMRKNTFLKNIGRARKLLADCLAQAGVDLAQELS